MSPETGSGPAPAIQGVNQIGKQTNDRPRIRKKRKLISFPLVGNGFTNIVTSLTSPDTRAGYGGPWFAAASALPLEGGLLQPRRLANLFATTLLRPGQMGALIALLLSTRFERVVLSESLTGEALREYFGQRSLGVFPQNQLCRGVLRLPECHSDYLRGRRRQALRTNLRKAELAGIRCEALSSPSRALDAIKEIANGRRVRSTSAETAILATMLTSPEVTLFAARDQLGRPLAIIAAVIDDAVCLIRVAVACSHQARWALHDHLVRMLIARRVRYLLADDGGPFGALGVDTSVHHFQRLLGYELLHLRPAPDRS